MVHVSDISMSNGRGLEQRFVHDKTYMPNRNSHIWPSKHRIILSDFIIWKRLFKWIYPVSNYSLHSPLKNWLNTDDWLKNWDWYARNSNIFLYNNLHNGKWDRHLLNQNCHHTFHSECLRMEDCPDETLYRASVQYKGTTIRLLNTSLFSDAHIEEEQEKDRFDAITISQPSIDWFMHHIEHSKTTSKLLSSLKEGSAISVSVGSYFPLHQVESCRWIVSTSNG